MSEWIEFNLNECVKVKLNQRGKNHVKKRQSWRSFDDGEYTTFQMWEFIEIFGEVTGLGMNPYYDNNVLIKVNPNGIDDKG